jgi:hypothetical protein
MKMKLSRLTLQVSSPCRYQNGSLMHAQAYLGCAQAVSGMLTLGISLLVRSSGKSSSSSGSKTEMENVMKAFPY